MSPFGVNFLSQKFSGQLGLWMRPAATRTNSLSEYSRTLNAKPDHPNPLSKYSRRRLNETHVGNFRQGGISVCNGGNRAARRVTCLVDGDTGWENGVKWRLKDTDTPELGRAECNNEHQKALAALDRLRALMLSGYSVEWLGTTGSYGRALVRITLSDGRDAGRVLIDEGLAQPWPNTGNVWCRR